jgi:hypothetical protein
MRFGLEQPCFLLRKWGCDWTNPPDYGKILKLELVLIRMIYATPFSERLDIFQLFV